MTNQITNQSILDEILKIRKRSIFHNVSDNDLKVIAEQCQIQRVKIGDIFVTQSEKTESMAVLIEGKAVLFNTLSNRKEFILTDLKIGRSVDLAAVLQDTPWHYNAQMKTAGTVLWVPRNTLITILKKDEDYFQYLTLMTLEPSIQDFSRVLKFRNEINFDHVKSLIHSFQLKEFDDGQVIQEQDKATEAIYLLRTGSVHVTQRNADLGQELLLRELTGSVLFAHHQIDRKQCVSIFKYVAGPKCTAWTIPLNSYLTFIDRYPFLKAEFDPSSGEGVKESKFLASTDAENFQPLKKQSKEKSDKIDGEDKDEDNFDYNRDEHYRKKFPIIIQHDEMDCAAACMAMISKYYKIDIGVSFFRNSIGVGVEGASMYGISNAAERVGFITRGVQVELEDLVDIKLPAITNQGYHFVVVYEVTSKYILIGDPEVGLRKLSYEEFKRGWSRVLLLFNVTAEFSKNQPEANKFKIYSGLLRPYAKYLIQILLISVLLNLLNLTGPVFSQLVLDRVIPTGDIDLLRVLTIGIIITLLLIVISGAIRRYFTSFMGLKLDIEMSSQFMRHLFRLPPKFFSTRRTGDTIMRLNDVEIIKHFATDRGIESIIDLTMLVFYTAAIFYYQISLGVLFLLSVVLFLTLTRFCGKKMILSIAERIKDIGAAQTYLIESLKNINTLKSFVAETSMRWKWEESFTRAGLYGIKVNHIANFLGIATDILVRGLPFFVLVYGTTKVLAKQMTIGQLMAIVSLFSMALVPLLNLSAIISECQRVLFGLVRLKDIFLTAPEDSLQKYLPISASAVKGHIQFENVSFRYGNEESPIVLNNVHLEIYPGQRVAMVGRSGSGKSTIIQLINRLYDPFEGRILIDGYDAKLYPLTELRRIVAVVTQDTKLLSGTIVENIALGDQFPDMQKVIRCAQLANADEFIRNQASGYFQYLCEDGIGLSGGQRQRIAIARALYRNPKILIMDEATSALDNESEAAIAAAIPEIFQGRTVIMIAHRLQSIQSCEHIFVVDNGSIIESGKHLELVKKNGAYSQLVRGSS